MRSIGKGEVAETSAAEGGVIVEGEVGGQANRTPSAVRRAGRIGGGSKK